MLSSRDNIDLDRSHTNGKVAAHNRSQRYKTHCHYIHIYTKPSLIETLHVANGLASWACALIQLS